MWGNYEEGTVTTAGRRTLKFFQVLQTAGTLLFNSIGVRLMVFLIEDESVNFMTASRAMTRSYLSTPSLFVDAHKSQGAFHGDLKAAGVVVRAAGVASACFLFNLFPVIKEKFKAE
eukprot:GHVT01073715.1.p1 GENE.GHVT01073715.1~~GHVT01073715.1.p1  ORF type:complete len:116 (-),score=7.90 GHVT01073715.1:489-836(-)